MDRVHWKPNLGSRRFPPQVRGADAGLHQVHARPDQDHRQVGAAQEEGEMKTELRVQIASIGDTLVYPDCDNDKNKAVLVLRDGMTIETGASNNGVWLDYGGRKLFL